MWMGVFFNYLTMAVAAAAWCAIIVLAIMLMVSLLRIARWYIKEHNIPPLFGRRNKKDREE